MKTQVKSPFIRPIIPIVMLTAMLALAAGCQAPKAAPDPLAGWHTASKNPNQQIFSDYQNYIRALSPEERKSVAYIEYFENGMGQYAVRITIGLNHTNWRHILIYDKENKRIKTIKYVSGRSMS